MTNYSISNRFFVNNQSISETRCGLLPELQVDGKPLGQSNAINFYLARQFGKVSKILHQRMIFARGFSIILSGFNGRDEWEAARIQECVMSWEDIWPKFKASYIERDVARKAELEKAAIEGALKPFYQRLQNYLDESGTRYLIGNQVFAGSVCNGGPVTETVLLKLRRDELKIVS